jgi:hypothetical protein
MLNEEGLIGLSALKEFFRGLYCLTGSTAPCCGQGTDSCSRAKWPADRLCSRWISIHLLNLQVIVLQVNETEFAIRPEPKSTIGRIKGQVVEMVDMPAPSQRVVHGPKEL